MNLDLSPTSAGAVALPQVDKDKPEAAAMGQYEVEATLCLTYLHNLPKVPNNRVEFESREIKYCSHPHLEPIIKSAMNQGLDLSDISNVVKELNKCPSLSAEVFKRPRWNKDSLILKLTNNNSNTAYALKLHTDEYPLARKTYSDIKMIKKVNNLGHTTKIHDVFLLGDRRKYWFILYEFIDGTPLKKAIAENQITYANAFDKLILMENSFRKLQVFLHFPSDAFLLSKDKNRIILTDWSAIEFAPEITEDKWKEYDCSEFVRTLLS